MPVREMLESYPLYRKMPYQIPHRADLVPKPAIHMKCPECDSEQTFNMVSDYWDHFGNVARNLTNSVVRLEYICTSCNKFSRYFLVYFAHDSSSVMKVGQIPPWDIKPDPEIERLLGTHADLFKKGLICESQGYGIGAFAYYRRIVEDIIDQLLDSISDLLDGEEQAQYAAALQEAKKKTVAQDKIALVKDLLPAILRPEGMNPLSILHSVLSKGLHEETDDECMDLAMSVREAVVFLVRQVQASRAASTSFTDRMRKLLKTKTKNTD